MKLELARAMLYNADLLLLDEVRYHRDLTRCRLLITFVLQPTNHVGYCLPALITLLMYIAVGSRLRQMARRISYCPH